MCQRDIRRLLITGAMAVVRWALRHGAPRNPRLARLLERKPPMVAASALANKMARGIWAMMTRGEDYHGPAIGSAA
jgi:transposase